jgi:ArsR family transcriptional regulator
MRVDITSVDGLERRAVLAMCRALADATRLDLMAAIWAGEKCVCDLQESVGGKPQNVVSHHLSVLREAGLVQSRRGGRWVYYRPADTLTTALQQALALLLGPRGDADSNCS